MKHAATPRVPCISPVRRLIQLIVVTAMAAATAVQCHATVLNVPATYATIQAAITAASNGDTVLVAPGTYTAVGDYNLDIGSKNLTITTSGGAATTILDYSGAGAGSQKHAITYQGGQTSASVFSGFTIKNGWFNNGAISIIDSSPTITQCIFLNNTAGGYGGAINIITNGTAISPTISRCVFNGNVAGNLSASTGFGGAIECAQPGNGTETVTITNCAFLNNDASYDGGAIDINSAQNASPSVHVVNCSFSKNNAHGFVASNVSGSVTAPSVGRQPGTIGKFGGVLSVTNCILFGDTSPTEVSTLDSGAVIDHTDVGQAGISGTGDINQDPLYLNANSDLRLAYNSPAINTGTTGAGIPTIDLVGNTRDSSPDMGAYEYLLTVTATAFTTSSQSLFTGQVATFNDSSGDTVLLSGLTATIQWGDSNSSSGTITQPGGVGTAYLITGTHNYAAPGSYTFTVTAATASVSASGTNTATVNATLATKFAVTATSPEAAGWAFSFTVTAQTAANATVANYSGPVHFTSSDGAASLPVDSTLTNGVGTFSATLNTIGSQTITATDTATSTITGTSNAISVTALPLVPTGLTAVASSARVNLSWTAGAAATSYSVYRGTTSFGQSATPVATGITTTTYQDTGLTDGTTYYYRVAAFNAVGNSPEGNQASAMPVATPTGLSATPGNTKVILSWTASAGATSYRVYRGTTSFGESATPIASGITATTYTNIGLTNGTTYYYRVAAFNATGNSPEGNQTAAIPLPPPPVPTGLTATAGNVSVVLSWTATASATSYNVYRGTTSFGQSATPITTGITATTYTNAGLVNGVTYYYRIAAVNLGGNSAEGNQAGAMPVATPVGLTATAGNAIVTLSWTASAGATSYNVYRGTTSFGQSATPIASGIAGTMYADAAVTNGVTYFYRVAAFNAGGNSPEGNQASAMPVAPPAVPTGLTATAGVGSVTLNWTASAGAATYNIYRGTTSFGESATPIATGIVPTTYVDTGLTPGTTYYYRIAAFNAGGNSAEGNQASATP